MTYLDYSKNGGRSEVKNAADILFYQTGSANVSGMNTNTLCSWGAGRSSDIQRGQFVRDRANERTSLARSRGNGKLWHSDGAMCICGQVPRSLSAREELFSRQHRAGGIHKIGPTAVTGNFRGRPSRQTFRYPGNARERSSQYKDVES